MGDHGHLGDGVVDAAQPLQLIRLPAQQAAVAARDHVGRAGTARHERSLAQQQALAGEAHVDPLVIGAVQLAVEEHVEGAAERSLPDQYAVPLHVAKLRRAQHVLQLGLVAAGEEGHLAQQREQVLRTARRLRVAVQSPVHRLQRRTREQRGVLRGQQLLQVGRRLELAGLRHGMVGRRPRRAAACDSGVVRERRERREWGQRRGLDLDPLVQCQALRPFRPPGVLRRRRDPPTDGQQRLRAHGRRNRCRLRPSYSLNALEPSQSLEPLRKMHRPRADGVSACAIGGRAGWPRGHERGRRGGGGEPHHPRDWTHARSCFIARALAATLA